MIIKLDVDPNLEKDAEKIYFNIKELTPEISNFIKSLQRQSVPSLFASKDNKKYKLEYSDIISLTSHNQKIYVKDKRLGTLYINSTLSSLITELPKQFLRISNSEIVNTNEVQSLDFTFKGKIKIVFKSGDFTYSSRSYLPKIKDFFHL